MYRAHVEAYWNSFAMEDSFPHSSFDRNNSALCAADASFCTPLFELSIPCRAVPSRFSEIRGHQLFTVTPLRVIRHHGTAHSPR